MALCCGATAKLQVSDLQDCARHFQWQPKAAALRWAGKALSMPCKRPEPSASAICICLRDREDDEGEAVEDRPAKRPKIVGPRSVRVRHILLRCAESGRCLPD